MLKRASILLGQNDIAGARLIFQYLAPHGSPGRVRSLRRATTPKNGLAARYWNDAGYRPRRTWYARAADLGSREAVAVLRKDKP